ncbi:UNVERIFIED_CONTAM: hypothetical protein K2H54_058677 [Gekko kuhli]
MARILAGKVDIDPQTNLLDYDDDEFREALVQELHGQTQLALNVADPTRGSWENLKKKIRNVYGPLKMFLSDHAAKENGVVVVETIVEGKVENSEFSTTEYAASR